MNHEKNVPSLRTFLSFTYCLDKRSVVNIGGKALHILNHLMSHVFSILPRDKRSVVNIGARALYNPNCLSSSIYRFVTSDLWLILEQGT